MIQKSIPSRRLSWMGLVCTALLLVACAPVSFESKPIESSSNDPSELYSSFFKMGVSQSNFLQPQLEANETQIAFQALLSNGNHITDLKASDLMLMENGKAVPGFQLKSNLQKIDQTVDIVFVVDITGSMEPTIESAKLRLINFINKSRASGRHTRMCLVTFGDYTVKKCDRFYDNNPKDPATEVQVKELISEISKLRALVGINDPGGIDLNENPLGALIDASKSPWQDKAERFAILITDDGFLFAPGNEGGAGRKAPRYQAALDAIANSQMKVFAATPSYPGYNRKFGALPGVVEASMGEWFNFAGLINGTITLDTILNRILDRVQSQYLVQYKIEETGGFDPTLPLDKRTIQVLLKDGRTATIVIQSLQSNLPNGRQAYPKTFKIGSDRAVLRSSVRTFVNGVKSDSAIMNEAGEIEFPSPPAAGSKIEAFYEYEELTDSVLLAPIVLNNDGSVSESNLIVMFNDQVASSDDYEIVKTLEGFLSIRVSERALSKDDRYGIRSNGGLEVRILNRMLAKL